MLAGMVTSSAVGGLAGLLFAFHADHALMETLASWLIGGLTAFLGFIALAHRPEPRRTRH